MEEEIKHVYSFCSKSVYFSFTLTACFSLETAHKLTGGQGTSWAAVLCQAQFPRDLGYVLCCVWLFVTPWTAAHHAPLSKEFSRQEYWRGCHFLLQGIFLTQGLDPGLTSSALAGGFFSTSAIWKAPGIWDILANKANIPANVKLTS